MAFARGGNKNFICRAKTIPRYSFREVFNLKDENATSDKERHIFLYVPIFQRRYCWGQEQVGNFIKDAIKIAYKPNLAGGSSSRVPFGNKAHSFGRIVISERDEDNGLRVVDGQQRMTTVCLFLSSVRDYFSKQNLSPELCQAIDDILFPLGREHGCILTPTYFDREPFNACINGFHTFQDYLKDSNNNVNSDIINVRRMCDHAIETGYVFKRVAAKFSDKPLGDGKDVELLELSAISFLQAFLDGFNILFFKMMDKTNTMNSYFRLAIREFGLKKQFSINSPGVGMATADLIRNLLLTCFNDEKKQLMIYQTYWAPIEKMARLTGLDQEKDKNVNMIKNMTIVLNKFIDEADDRIVEKGKEAQSKLKWQDPSIVLFPLYTKLLTCIEGELSMNGIEVPIVLSTVSPEIENIVLKWLKKFKAFCDKAFATGIDNIEKSNESKETGGIFKGKRKGTYLSSMDDASSMRKNKDNNNNDNFKNATMSL